MIHKLKGKRVQIQLKNGSLNRGYVRNNAEQENGIFLGERKVQQANLTWTMFHDAFIPWSSMTSGAMLIFIIMEDEK